MNCRSCGAPLEHLFLDLGFAPPSNAFLEADDLHRPERYYPLRLLVCDRCWLVQTEDYAEAGDLFTADYVYFSSVSKTWLDHAESYARLITQRLGLGAASLVVEVAANDGYLLRNFVAAGIPCLGIEPTASTAQAAERLGIPILREFFGRDVALRLAREGRLADLIAANNVFAHVPDVNDFSAGLKAALKPAGVVTLEFPHLMRLLERVQFDTVYHEHFSYFSLHAVTRILERAGLRVWDVEELPTHGGSLRVYACHAQDPRAASDAVARILAEEAARGMLDLAVYRDFQPRVEKVKDDFVSFLIESKRAGRRVGAYGAAAKGNTLINYAGVKPDLIGYVCDAAPSKQGRFLPGSHIPVLAPAELRARRPDVVIVLPWNIADEVVRQHGYIREWGGRFATLAPELRFL
ncbi:MAG: methyltransferase domain-containing protein [Usitatibacter sp.]